MGNTVIPATKERINKALEKFKNTYLELEERKILEQNNNETLSQVRLTRGTFEELGWEIEEMIEKEYYFQESCKRIELDKTFFDVILCTDVVQVRLFGYSVPALFYDDFYEKIRGGYPMFLCTVPDKYKITASLPASDKKIKFYGLLFKRTEKFNCDMAKIKAGEVRFRD